MKINKLPLLITCLLGIYLPVTFSTPCTAVYAQGPPLETVTIQLKWHHQFQFAGYYAAKEKGFYAVEGLDVALIERNSARSHIQSVLDGDAEYGVADAGLLLSRITGKPVVLLKQIFQHSPLVFLSHKDSGITSPYDMTGKRVMLDIKGQSQAPLFGMLLKSLQSLDKITVVPHSFNSEDFISGKIDVISAYLTDQPFALRQQGVEINIINPHSFGIDFYGDNLFTTEEEITKHPERVEKMIRATLKGWKYALENNNEIIDLIINMYNPKLTRELLIYEAKMTDLMILSEFTPIGTVSALRFEQIADVYERAGLAKKRIDLSRFIYGSPGDAAKKPELSLTDKEKFTDEEQAWLAEHPVIRIGIMDAWAPFNFVDTTGTPRGIGVDYIAKLNARLNGVLEIVPGKWSVIYDDVKERRLDALMDITPKPSRQEYFNFTTPYLDVPHVIVARQDAHFMRNEDDLNGKILALEKGFGNVKYFRKKYPQVQIIEYPDTPHALGAVARGEADAYAGNRAVSLYLIEQEVLTNLKTHGRLNKSGSILAIGTRKDWPILRDILQKALNSISFEEKHQLLARWVKPMQKNTNMPVIDLTVKEKEWLTRHPIIKVGMDPMWAPVEFVDDNGEFKGISPDFLKFFSERLNIEFVPATGLSWLEVVEKMKAGKLDLHSAVMATPSREKYLNFCKPYISLPLMIFTPKKHPYITDLRQLKDKGVTAVIKGYAIAEFMKRDHPDLELLEVKNVDEALRALTSGKVAHYIGTLLTTTYNIQKLGYADIKIAGETPYTFELTLAARKDLPELHSIMNKTLSSISEEERNTIFHKWRTMKFEHGFDYSILLKILSPVAFCILILVYWNRRLTREVTRRTEAEEEIMQRDERLRLHYENTPLGVIEWDPDFRVVEWNRAAEQIFGYSVDEAKGKKAADLIIPESARHHMDTVWEQLLSRKGGERNTNMNITKNGQTIWCDWHNTPLTTRVGECVGVVSLVEDITEKKQAENERHNHMEELQRFNKAMVGREKRIIELKKEINQLCRESGRGEPFISVNQKGETSNE